MGLTAGEIATTTSGLFVLDGSVTVAWFFGDDLSDYAASVLSGLRVARAVVPALWAFEIANAVAVGERRKRSSEAQAATWLEILGGLPIEIDGETAAQAWGTTLSLARAQSLSAYEAAYLELAMRRGVPLATLDDRLAAAAANVGVSFYKSA